MAKNINLCGLGNGLVDIQCEVNDNEISELNLIKGAMQLVSEEEQGKLLDRFKTRDNFKSSGGSAANTIIAFTKFGGSAAYLTSLGNDDWGRFYANEFKEIGINLDAHYINALPTGTCMILISPDAERTMNTCLGASGFFAGEHVDENIIADSDWLYLEGYRLTSDKGFEAVVKAAEYAKKHNTKIAVTISDIFITLYYKKELEQIISQSDLLFCNESEAKSYTNTEDSGLAFKKLCELCPNVVMTMGADGSLIKWNNEILNIPAYSTVPVDTTGAGDMFAAGFFYGVICENSPLIGGHLGSYAASLVVSQYGARLKNDHKEVRDFIISKNKN